MAVAKSAKWKMLCMRAVVPLAHWRNREGELCPEGALATIAFMIWGMEQLIVVPRSLQPARFGYEEMTLRRAERKMQHEARRLQDACLALEQHREDQAVKASIAFHRFEEACNIILGWSDFDSLLHGAFFVTFVHEP
jgi:hypothetical protein